MSAIRKIKKVIKSKPTIEGAGVHLNRVFAFGTEKLFDPFLLLDDFRSDNPRDYDQGFPWHPHRGIETVTYMLDGMVEHEDSMGNKGVISAGDIQWMTAGSGIIHQEMPVGDENGVMGGFQLWANLPAANKMMDPRYQEVKSQKIPEIVTESGSKIRVICGKVGSVQGPVQDIVTNPEYLDISLPPHVEFVHPTQLGHTVFVYVIGGKGCICHENNPFSYDIEGQNYFDMERQPLITNGELVLFEDGEKIILTTTDEPVRFLLVSGKPIGEPIAWYGPIVMNTRAELQVAFKEYQNNTFVKVNKK